MSATRTSNVAGSEQTVYGKTSNVPGSEQIIFGNLWQSVAGALAAAMIASIGATGTTVLPAEWSTTPAITGSNLVWVNLMPSRNPHGRPSRELMASFAGALPPGTFPPGYLSRIRSEWE